MGRLSTIPSVFRRWTGFRAATDEFCLEIRVGDRVHIQPDRDDEDLLYPGRIEDVQEDTVELWVPAAAHLPQLTRGRSLRVTLEHEGREYFFDSHIVGRLESRDPFLVLALPQELEPVNQRRYFRVSAIIEPTRAALLDEEGREARELAATVLDIGGSGIHFVSSDPLSRGDHLRVVLPLSDIGVIDTEVEVTGIRNRPTSRGRYRLDARFARLTDQQRDQIFRFLFQQQIALRKKGLL